VEIEFESESEISWVDSTIAKDLKTFVRLEHGFTVNFDELLSALSGYLFYDETSKKILKKNRDLLSMN
jgi:hypothetical protein